MRKWLIVGIVVLGFLLRIIGLSNHPAGFTPDEASFGYDAYSILKTGKDQWGHTLPLVLKSFGDDKLPLYTYLDVPFIAVFGLNETAVRLPNALLGTFAIVVTYLLVKELFNKQSFGETGREELALFSSFLLAISPWHVMLSRGAFEANLTTFFLPLGVLFFLRGLRNNRLLLLSFFVFLLNIFTYHTARLLTPVILVILIYQYHKNISTKKILIYLGVVMIALISIVGVVIGGSRIASSAIFNDVNTDSQYFSVRAGEPYMLAKVFNNKLLIVGQNVFRNYISYFSPQFLFTSGPNEATYGMVPGAGVLYLVEAIFIGGYLFKLVKKGFLKEDLLLVGWIILSPIPASLAKGPGLAANRAAFMMPALQIISGVGAIFLYESLNKKIKKTALIITGFVFVFLFSFFLNDYFVKQRAIYAKDMIYGAKEIFTYLNTHKDTQALGANITKSLSEPHIYAAFYTKMEPTQYQEETKKWKFEEKGLQWVDQMAEYSLGDYTFSDNYNLASRIVVVPPEQVPQQACKSEIKNKIYLPNGKEIFYIRYNSTSLGHEC